MLIAGPYLSRWKVSLDPYCVKLAPEINSPFDVAVNIDDYGIPDEREFKYALYEAAKRLMDDREVFVGCGYGIGRTGIFLGALFKLHREVLRRAGIEMDFSDTTRDPVFAVRHVYYYRAIETHEQERFVRSLDVRWLARVLAFKLHPAAVFDKRFWIG